MKKRPRIISSGRLTEMALVYALAAYLGLCLMPDIAQCQGYWSIALTGIDNASYAQINNSGEIVWQSINGGIFSSVRGLLSSSGVAPSLANSGEVVYAEAFGGHSLDLVSTTRGRLTFNGSIETNVSGVWGFDVNSAGEVVYLKRDRAGYLQVFSTVRGQVTFDATDHNDPCISDTGEIVWVQFGSLGRRTYSSTRGILNTNFGNEPRDLNDEGEVCFSAGLFTTPTTDTSPHVASSLHGVLINDANAYQYGGSLNDAGTIVYDALDPSGGSTWPIYEANWVVPEPSVVALVVLGLLALRCSERRRSERALLGKSQSRPTPPG